MNSTQELYRQLEQKLMEELAMVRRLMGKEETAPIGIFQIEKTDRKEPVRGVGVPKANLTWEEYIPIILNELGGRGKTTDVSNYAAKANPKLKPDRILDAVRGNISKLYRSEKIGAQKGAAKSEGYEYFIK